MLLKTSAGDIKLELYSDKTPITVTNFMQYVDDGQYNQTIFHRVISGFMIQGGGFTKDMRQKPTRYPIKNEAALGVKNSRGTIAMARTPVIDSATCQFFINVVDNAALDHKNTTQQGYGYCAFGKVIEGMEVVDRIKAVQTGRKGSHANVPLEPVEILEATRVKKYKRVEKLKS